MENRFNTILHFVPWNFQINQDKVIVCQQLFDENIAEFWEKK